jgi:hypothetical protein
MNGITALEAEGAVVPRPCRSGLVYYEARSSRRNRVRMSSPVDSSRPLVHDPPAGRVDGAGQRDVVAGPWRARDC